jgi:outer membrane protein OmpA-like peptidoglycan-associated protein
MKTRLFTAVLVLLTAGTLMAQTPPPAPGKKYGLPKGNEFDRVSIGLTIGASHLNSDMLKGDADGESRVFKNNEWKPAFGLQINHQISHSIGLRFRGMFTNFYAEDEELLDSVTFEPILFNNNSTRGKLYEDYMETPVSEFALEMTYNFGNISFLNRNKNFHFVTTLGIGVFNFDSEVKEQGTDKLLRSTGTVTEVMIPMSLGVKYKIGKVDIGLAVDYRQTFTDRIDATVKTYSEFDDYIMGNISVNYTLGKKNRPMEWVNPMEVVYSDISELKEKIDIMSGDKDKDGVSDLFDKDNNTPEGVKVYGDGTTVDSDGDGIPDGKDSDPFTPKGARVDANGAEIDTDSDGVADSRDLEPNTPAGSLVNFQGLTLAKPGEYGKDGLSGKGKDGVSFLPSVFFDLGGSSIKPTQYDRLVVIAKAMKANPDIKVRITGNCDVQGSDNENQRLGLRRADAVKNHLVSQYGIDPARLTTESKGESDPMAKSINGVNRRVDFSVE